MAWGLNKTNPVKSRRFSSVALAYLETFNRIGRPLLYRDDLNKCEIELLSYFGGKDVASITNSYVDELIKKPLQGRFTPAAVNNYIIVLRKILNYDCDDQLIQFPPNLPKIKVNAANMTKWGYFDWKECKDLTEVVDVLVKEGKSVIEYGSP